MKLKCRFIKGRLVYLRQWGTHSEVMLNQGTPTDDVLDTAGTEPGLWLHYR